MLHHQRPHTEMSAENHAGVLSQTLASSPCITHILSARVRNRHHNDVVMVAYSSIHLRELLPNENLSNIIAHLELGSEILSAKVISAIAAEREVPSPDRENGKGDIEWKIDGKEIDEALPPQIVVLSTNLGELVYVYARVLNDGSSQFIHSRHPVISKDWPRIYGKHLAVDPESRALAIASIQGGVALLPLRNVRELKDAIDHWDPRARPQVLSKKDQKFFPVDGIILRMDFLGSPMAEPRRVILLIISASRGVSTLNFYRWDSWRDIDTAASLKKSAYVLSREDAFPQLLIPSCRRLSFAMVTRNQLVFYDDFLSDHKNRRVFHLTSSNDESKQWVQWTRPARHKEYSSENEAMFLVREDGLVKYANVTYNSSPRVHLGVEPGHLHINVDTAVCALSGEVGGGDILIVCGESTEGGVFRLRAREPPIHTQPLANWSPITDVVTVRDQYGSHGDTGNIRMIAATGVRDSCAYLSELRYGVEAQIIETVDFEDAATVDQLWVLNQVSLGRQLLLTSHHEYSSVVCVEASLETLFACGPEIYPQLGFDHPTLAACNIDGDSILQITTAEIHVLGPADQPPPIDAGAMKGNFICAGVDPDGGIFAVVAREEQNLQLAVGTVFVTSEKTIDILPLPQVVPLDYLPVSLAIANLAGRRILIAGSSDGFLHLYYINQDSGITFCQKWQCSSFHDDLADANISSVAVISLPNAHRGLVICGLKTGQLMIFELVARDTDEAEEALLSLLRVQVLGQSAVVINTGHNTPSDDEASAYAVCGYTVLQARLFDNARGLDFTLNTLLLTSAQTHHKPYLEYPFYTAVRAARLSTNAAGPLCGLLVGVIEDRFLLFILGESALIPKQIARIKPTQHLVYSPQMRRYIASVTSREPHGQPGTLQSSGARPSLQLIDDDRSDSNQNPRQVPSNFQFGEAGEKIRALLYWTPSHNQLHHEMVVIGSDRGEDGRLSCISMKRLSRGKSEVSPKLMNVYKDQSIHAMCEYGMSSLVVGVGKHLRLVRMEWSDRLAHFTYPAEFELPSPATELRTQGSVIYVGTKSHSYMLFTERDGRFHKIGCDSWASRARNVVPYGSSSTLVNMIDERGSRIHNFNDSPSHGDPPSFEAVMTDSIDKIVHVKSATSDGSHERFVGTTLDGTVYMFTTLNKQEMKLLAFLERLCKPPRNEAEVSIGVLARRIRNRHGAQLKAAGIWPPLAENTHARGDVLKALLAPGVYNIFSLLQERMKSEDDTSIKSEDEMERLRELAIPVIGETTDVVEGVVLWLRRLLNVPVF